MPIIAQHKWSWCSKCEGLFYSGSSAGLGHCPAGGTHTKTGSGDYALFAETQPAGFPANVMAQSNWHWCSQCGCLWIPTSALPKGCCPCPAAGSKGHTSAGSGNYTLLAEP